MKGLTVIIHRQVPAQIRSYEATAQLIINFVISFNPQFYYSGASASLTVIQIRCLTLCVLVSVNFSLCQNFT